MLSLLHIENIALIERADIAFGPGFNVLTGETGAGKSIIIDAIGAVLGLFLCAKGIGFLLNRYEQMTYSGILGFVVGSIFTLVPANFQLARDGLVCALVLIAGGLITYLFNRAGHS